MCPEKMKIDKAADLWFPVIICLLVILNIVLHLIFNANLEYHRDELLYFSLGRHPDIGFATVPPMIGWIAWLMQTLFGYSLFAVRLFPAIMSGIMVLIVMDLARELGGKRYAMILAGVGIIISIFEMRTFSLFQPVHLDLLFWTLVFYIIIKYINTGNDKYLLILGIVAGLSLLNKYLIAFLFAILVIAVLFSEFRNIFRKKMFWYGILAGAIIFMPNIIWQIDHGLPVINHLSELSRSQLVNVDRMGFLKEQLIMPGAASFLTIAGLVVLLFSKKPEKTQFLGFTVIIVILGLMLMRGKSYYTIGVFPLLISAGSVFYESVLRRWYTRTVFIALIVIISIFLLPFGFPVYKSEGLVNYFNTIESKYGFDFGRTFEDGSKHSLPQDYADMLGWEELTLITDKAWRMIPDKESAFIYCENYGQAGAITIIGKKYGLPEAVSFHESFRYWIPTEFDPDVTSLIYINDEPGEDVIGLFRKIIRVGSISNPDAREYGTGVYLCENPVVSFNSFWKERLKLLNGEN
jgi:hypothetical protein